MKNGWRPVAAGPSLTAIKKRGCQKGGGRLMGAVNGYILADGGRLGTAGRRGGVASLHPSSGEGISGHPFSGRLS